MPKPIVYLVGAGPGDPGLITVKGLRCLHAADVVVYDRLANPRLLSHAREGAEMIYVGKASSQHAMKQDDINQLLVDKAKEGKIVCRLKGGDPYVYGRGGEEAETLVANGIAFEEVPGVTSAIGAAAYAGIPVTHRKLCSALGIVTGHEDPTKTESSIRWDKLATAMDTLVFLMGVENLPNIVSRLVANGRAPETPVALVRWGTMPCQETLVGTLADIVEKVRAADFKSPAVTVVGEVVNLRETLRWFDNRPLFGKRILVTRAREQASELSAMLEEAGAEAVEFPVIKIEPVDNTDAADRLASFRYDWVLFTSANAVSALREQLKQTGRDIRALGAAKLGAIGPATAQALQSLGLKVDFVPSEFVAEKVAEDFPEDPNGLRILIPRAQEAREVLPEKLTDRGAEVEVVPVYRTLPNTEGADAIREQLAAGEIDLITFASSSTVTNFLKATGEQTDLTKTPLASIGPITTETAIKNGLTITVQPKEYTIPALVEVIEGFFKG